MINTAEQAATIRPTTATGKFTSQQMVQAISAIRKNQPELVSYLSHPEIVIGLANGRFGPNGLTRRLQQMLAVDEGE